MKQYFRCLAILIGATLLAPALRAVETKEFTVHVLLAIPDQITKNGNTYKVPMNYKDGKYLAITSKVDIDPSLPRWEDACIKPAYKELIAYFKDHNLPLAEGSIGHLKTYQPTPNRDIVTSYWLMPLKPDHLSQLKTLTVGNDKAGKTDNDLLYAETYNIFGVNIILSNQINEVKGILAAGQINITIYHLLFTKDNTVAVIAEKWIDIKYPHNPNNPLFPKALLKEYGISADGITPMKVNPQNGYALPFVNSEEDPTREGNFAIAQYWKIGDVAAKAPALRFSPVDNYQPLRNEKPVITQFIKRCINYGKAA